MKRLFLTLFALCIALSVIGQETTRQKEIGLLFRDLDSFGLGYKTGTASALWRFNTMLLNGSTFQEERPNSETEGNSFGFNMGFGREFRRDVAKNLEIRYGADVNFAYQYRESEREDSNNPDRIDYNESRASTAGINLIFGFNYVINNSLIIGAELLPGVDYTTRTTRSQDFVNEEEVKRDISTFNYGISNITALLSLSYRF